MDHAVNSAGAARRLSFASDYMEGAHPAILRRLQETNMLQTPGYGADGICRSARERIRAACACPSAAVHFLVGGTQTNAVVIGAVLRSYQGVIAAETGHICTHEAGAIECGGHKILTLPHSLGKLSADAIRSLCQTYREDENRDHTVMPGMVYLSHPTEYGTLYSREELTAIRAVCDEYRLPLYLDGARLAYALACPENDLTLPDIARLCDVFYIGGTKCGALFGEAVVIPNPSLLPHFFTVMKQNGALLAKGRLLGLQFDALFTDGLYEVLGAPAITAAQRMRRAFRDTGYALAFDTPTNQVFVLLEDDAVERLSRAVDFGFWEKPDPAHTVVRFVSSWATPESDVEKLLDILKGVVSK